MATGTDTNSPRRLAAFPLAWVTTGRRLLIVGGGVETRARVTTAGMFDWQQIDVVMPTADAALRATVSGDARFVWSEREPVEDDVRNANFVIRDTPDARIAQNVHDWCRLHKVPLNATDDPPACDVFYTSLIVRPPLAISISTGGESPALAAALRRWLEPKIGPGWTTAAQLLADLRRDLPPGHDRRNLLRSLGHNLRLLECIETNDEAGMRDQINQSLGVFMSAPASDTPRPSAAHTAPHGSAGIVALVGCPADPGLLSRRAEQYLRKADVVFHDRLIPNAILRLAGDRAYPVNKEGGHDSTPQEEIHRLLLTSAESGKLVVRLHGGDPGIYGRLNEELEFLDAHGIRVDIIPAPTAIQVCAAHARASLTDRSGGHRVTFFSAHAAEGSPPPTPPGPDCGNLAVYMGVAEIKKARTSFAAAGWPDTTPVIAGARLGTRDERIIQTTLGEIGSLNISPPAVFLLGAKPGAKAHATLFLGDDPEPYLRHGPLIEWSLEDRGQIGLPARPFDRVIFTTPALVRSYFDLFPAERSAPRQWLATTPATQEELRTHGLENLSKILS